MEDGVAFFAAGDNQRRNDGQGQRNLYSDCRASAEAGLNVDGTADLLNVRLHHIHADTASGDVGHFFRRGKSGKKNQVEDLPLRHAGCLFGGNHGAFDRLLANAFDVQAGAIVTDLDDNLPPFVKRAQNQTPGPSLPGFGPVFGKLDAMVNGIAHQMRKRIFDRLDDGFIELGVFALHLDGHFLAATERDVPHRPRKLVPYVPNRLHAGLHDVRLQLRGDQVHAFGNSLQAGVFQGIG